MTRISDPNRVAPTPPQPDARPEAPSPIRSSAALTPTQEVDHSTSSRSVGAPALQLAPPQVTAPRLDGESISGARSFAGQLVSLGMPPGDHDNLVAQFLRLQILDMSANQDFQNLLFAGHSILMQAAFAQERAMRGIVNDVDNMRAQADSLEDNAERQASQALVAMQGTQDGSSESGVSGESGVDMAQLERDLWAAAYDSLLTALVDAATKITAAEAGGEDAAAHKDEAYTRAMRAAEILEGLGFPSDEATVRELIDYANASLAEGGNGQDIFARYYAAHPERLDGLVSPADVERIRRSGPTNADMLKIIEAQRGSTGNFAALEYIDEDDATELLSRYEAMYPEAMGSAMPYLTAAADAYAEATDLRARINLVLSTHWDVITTISGSRSASNTHGVSDRSAGHQMQILRSIGDIINNRSAEKARDARVDLQQHRAEVARLTLAVIDRHAAMSSEQSHGGRV